MGGPSWLDAVLSSGVVLAVLGFFGIRALNRIDALEKEKANKSDLKELIDEIRADRKAASDSREKLYNRVNDLALSVAYMQGADQRGISPGGSSSD